MISSYFSNLARDGKEKEEKGQTLIKSEGNRAGLRRSRMTMSFIPQECYCYEMKGGASI